MSEGRTRRNCLLFIALAIASPCFVSLEHSWRGSVQKVRHLRFGSDMRRRPLVAMSVKFVSKEAPTYAPVDVQKFYEETISGSGGAPRGIERDLITKEFGGDVAGRGDHAASLQALRARMEEGTSFEGEDDGSGWIWLVADLTLDGLTLDLQKKTPYGQRPLLVARQDKVGELFDKVNWNVARRRLNELLGLRDANGKKYAKPVVETETKKSAGQEVDMANTVLGTLEAFDEA
eukprot:TRINITY_DN110092_c0_g1_i1.p1 TRINITY_DN110092_c0_g1~~TRINITY_DN110092_c0_g1_i1.p1  ORF type:complete len:250 (+),score=41.66 TRINITY_DN110092_c0_g1_i1:53-751(+)